MVNRFKYAVLSSVILVGLVLYVSTKNEPIPTGDAEDFWKFACGVEVEKFDGHFAYTHETGILPSKDEWYFYYFQEHHGRHVFKVKKDVLLLEAKNVLSRLNQEIVSSVQDDIRANYIPESNEKRVVCLDLMNQGAYEPGRFIDAINSEVANKSSNFDAQWKKSKRYWVSIVFEMTFIPFWWLFSFHRGIFGRLNRNGATRLAFSPLLLFVPHFLGYAPYLFSFGSSGGILYPLFAGLMSLPFGWLPLNSVEIFIFGYMPQPLSYISQVPFSPMAVSFYGGVSPTVLLMYAGLVLMLNKMLLRYRASKRS